MVAQNTVRTYGVNYLFQFVRGQKRKNIMLYLDGEVEEIGEGRVLTLRAPTLLHVHL